MFVAVCVVHARAGCRDVGAVDVVTIIARGWSSLRHVLR